MKARQETTSLVCIPSKCKAPCLVTKATSSLEFATPPKVIVIPSTSNQKVTVREDSTEDLKKATKLMIIPSKILDPTESLKVLRVEDLQDTELVVLHRKSMACKFPSDMRHLKVQILVPRELAIADCVQHTNTRRSDLTSILALDCRRKAQKVHRCEHLHIEHL
ncbi:uncharacterized protein [Eurosta solidaginis]|uniref:uncharacterized protein n=1 Tax=Eurosta solidaginis TaxID=178769 RepID=UPI0035314AED